ncbi:hypothetical protein [Sulfurimonas paralvinellae]|uniref:Uncharacterized protein n=1 Tax=Sulfurimonas paralvinellae TaxID=317658 RepID=A0A7M1B7N6_9BACT|nr:hypothetical protein [Sulfurimonas paralvinellae]QOP44788.1 hypothetical protein FM071_00110 [Sulfurimonas paralvinellae]
MRKTIKKYLNIYVVTALIGGFSVLYLFSFAFVLNDVTGGSSREMKKKYCKKNPDECNVTLKRQKLRSSDRK